MVRYDAVTAMLPPLVFVCYAREDAKHRDALVLHLAGYQRNGIIRAFVDVEIRSGAEWDATIHHALEEASVGVLLVSAAWLGSEFIANREVPRLFHRWHAGECSIHWLPLSAVDLGPDALPHVNGQPVPLTALQCLIDPGRPIESLRGNARTAAWSSAATKVKTSAVARGILGGRGPGTRSSAELAELAGVRPLLTGRPGPDLVTLVEALLHEGDGSRANDFVSKL